MYTIEIALQEIENYIRIQSENIYILRNFRREKRTEAYRLLSKRALRGRSEGIRDIFQASAKQHYPAPIAN